MMPRLVKTPIEDRKRAMHELLTHWRLPNGDEVIDGRALHLYRKQIAAGYYYHLEWPSNATREEILEWISFSARVLEWHKLGVV